METFVSIFNDTNIPFDEEEASQSGKETRLGMENVEQWTHNPNQFEQLTKFTLSLSHYYFTPWNFLLT